MASGRMELTFWGVRGGIPTPGPETARFGGNSPCVGVDRGDRIVVFDGGTGLRALGQALVDRSPVRGDILFSHATVNRICGLPFFAAAFRPENGFAFWCGRGPEEDGIRAVLTRLMTDPVFPVPIEIFAAELAFNDFRAGASFALAPGLDVASLPVSRGLPGAAYRLDCAAGSLVYACAIRPPDDLSGLVDFARGGDVLVTSLLCDDAETADRIAIEIAQEAGVGRLFVTDHPPGASDDDLLRREDAARRLHPGCALAREGDSVDVAALRRARP